MYDVMNQANKNSSPCPDRITPEPVLNGGKNPVTALNILMQASYQLGYFLKSWEKEKIYLKKPEKSSYSQTGKRRAAEKPGVINGHLKITS